MAVAGEVKIILAADATSYSAAMQKVKRQLKDFETASGSGAQASKRLANEIGHSVPQFAAASGAVRVLEGNINNNVRAAERFLSTTLRLGPVLQRAFPVVGAIAFGAVIAHMGERLIDFIRNNDQAAKKVAQDWGDSARRVQDVNDALDLENAKLSNQIAQLEHKPQNMLAQALLEARVEADQLDQKLRTAIDDARNLLQERTPGLLQQMWSGKSAPAHEKTMLVEHRRWLDLAENPEQLLSESKNFGAALQARLAELESKEATQTALYQRQLQGAAIAGNVVLRPSVDYQNEIEAVKDLIANQQREQHFLEASALVKTQTARLGGDQQAADLAAKGAQELLRQQMSAVNERVKLLVGSSVRIPNEGRAAMRMQAEDIVPGWGQRNPAVEMTEDLTRSGERWRAYNQAVLEGYEAQARFRQQLALTQIQFEADSGAISRHEALIRDLTVETNAYKAHVLNLGDRMDQVRGDSGLTGEQRATQLQQLQNEVDASQRAYQMKVMEIEEQVRATTVMGELHDSILRVASDFSDLGREISDVLLRGLQDFNQTLVHVLATPASWLRGQHPWRNLGADVAQMAGGAALQWGEGKLLTSLLGHNPNAKLGSRDNPMYVRDADAASGSAAGGLLGKLLGVGTSAVSASGSGSGAGQLVGSILGGALSGMAGFATGGMIPSNTPVLVGENGPEILAGAGGRTVIPNDQIGGSSLTINNHFAPGTGAADRAMIEQTVNRAIMRSVPMMQRGVVAHLADRSRRSPRGRAF